MLGLGLGLLLATGEAVECEVPKGCRVSPVGAKEPPPTFETRSAWQEHVDLILNLRGPKW